MLPVVSELTGCLSVTFAVMRHAHKQLGEERVCLAYNPDSQSITGSQGTNLESRADAEAMEDSCLLFVTCSASFIVVAVSF